MIGLARKRGGERATRRAAPGGGTAACRARDLRDGPDRVRAHQRRAARRARAERGHRVGRAGVAERDGDVAQQLRAGRGAAPCACQLAELVRALARERDRSGSACSGARRSRGRARLAGARVERADLLADVAAEHPRRRSSGRSSRGIAPWCSIVRYEMQRRASSTYASTNAPVGHASRHARQLPQRGFGGSPAVGAQLDVDEQLAEHDVAAERRARSASCSSRRSRGRRARPTRARAPAPSRRTAAPRPAGRARCASRSASATSLSRMTR